MQLVRMVLTALSLFVLSATTWPQSNCVPAPANYSVTDLGTIGGVSSFAKAINNAGSVTGSASTAAGDTHPFLWTGSTGMQDLGTLGGTLAQAYSINSTGYVVGYSNLANFGIHAFLWTPTTGMQDLGALNGSTGTSFAFGIDDHNHSGRELHSGQCFR